MILHGQPQALDTVVKPIARVVQVVLGLAGSGALACLGAWWWVPVPLAASFLLYEVVFHLRGDRPIRVVLDDPIEVHDPRRGQHLTVDPRTIVVATAHRRPTDDGRADLRVVLADGDGPRLALWLRIPADTPPLPWEVDAALTDRILGGDFGSLRALAPGDRVARQRLDDDGSAVRWLREHLPADAWSRTGARVWRGAAPALDLLGHLEGPPTAWLVLDGAAWRLSDGRHGMLRWEDGGRAERTAVLLSGPGDPEPFVEDRVPLALLALAPGIVVATPSPRLGTRGTPTPLHDGLLHTHPAEAAGLLSHLLRTIETGAWPPNVSHVVSDARALPPGCVGPAQGVPDVRRPGCG